MSSDAKIENRKCCLGEVRIVGPMKMLKRKEKINQSA